MVSKLMQVIPDRFLGFQTFGSILLKTGRTEIYVRCVRFYSSYYYYAWEISVHAPNASYLRYFNTYAETETWLKKESFL